MYIGRCLVLLVYVYPMHYAQPTMLSWYHEFLFPNPKANAAVLPLGRLISAGGSAVLGQSS